jgi:hypothetical protein
LRTYRSSFPFGALCLTLLLNVCVLSGKAQDRPYFVSYWHDMEDVGEIEIESKTSIGGSNSPFGAMATEAEVGLRSWWTFGFYFDGQVTDEDSAISTGYRFENRFRPLKGEHAVNPILYFEYEDISKADKTVLEVVGHDGESDIDIPNGVARRAHQHEGELRLILSSNVRAWNVSENFISEKNLGHAPWEFGYGIAVSRPLRANPSKSCAFCLDKFVAGGEMYGGLGDTSSLTLRNTSHYFAPVVGWNVASRARFSFSPGFGLTDPSLSRIYRIGFTFEFGGFRPQPVGTD